MVNADQVMKSVSATALIVVVWAFLIYELLMGEYIFYSSLGWFFVPAVTGFGTWAGYEILRMEWKKFAGSIYYSILSVILLVGGVFAYVITITLYPALFFVICGVASLAFGYLSYRRAHRHAQTD